MNYDVTNTIRPEGVKVGMRFSIRQGANYGKPWEITRVLPRKIVAMTQTCSYPMGLVDFCRLVNSGVARLETQ